MFGTLLVSTIIPAPWNILNGDTVFGEASVALVWPKRIGRDTAPDSGGGSCIVVVAAGVVVVDELTVVIGVGWMVVGVEFVAGIVGFVDLVEIAVVVGFNALFNWP